MPLEEKKKSFNSHLVGIDLKFVPCHGLGMGLDYWDIWFMKALAKEQLVSTTRIPVGPSF